uniref:Uncharacterized protein n=1 Tax=Romanomermis culicivorax TaxID=13658 RepID=A0A915HEW2_ROMCU
MSVNRWEWPNSREDAQDVVERNQHQNVEDDDHFSETSKFLSKRREETPFSESSVFCSPPPPPDFSAFDSFIVLSFIVLSTKTHALIISSGRTA